jgi:hypothetical protein
MGAHPIDGYLLTGSPAKDAAIAAVLADPQPVERAQPFYRALTVLGDRAADEALVALRLALAGKIPDDVAVSDLREKARAARAGDADARAAYFLMLEA